jgi:branched-chain amino acid aminotransferase
MPNEKAWINGSLTEIGNALLPLSTSALHYGTAAFEGVICFGQGNSRMILRLSEHIDRLFYSAEVLGLKIPFQKEEVAQAIVDLIRFNGFDSCYLRPVIFRQADYLGIWPRQGKIVVAILGQRFNKLRYFLAMRRKIRVIVSDQVTVLWPEIISKAKISGKYLYSAIAQKEATQKQADDALILDSDKLISEATAANIFIVKNGILYTPRRLKTLNGIVQDTIIRIARDNGYKAAEENISLNEFYAADEAFLTSTAKGVVSIDRVNSKKIGNKTRITKILRTFYLKTLIGKYPPCEDWLTVFQK